MARLNIARQEKLEPKRLEYAKAKITELGFEIIEEGESTLRFVYKGSIITFFAYSGWATGKTIKDGRGLENLLKQLKTT
jgi:hypothetical protein